MRGAVWELNHWGMDRDLPNHQYMDYIMYIYIYYICIYMYIYIYTYHMIIIIII